MESVERLRPLGLRGGALAIYRQLSVEQKADEEQIKQALITAYTTDAYNAYDQFVTRQFCPDETVDKYFLARLVGKLRRGGGISISLLPDRLNTKKLPSMKVHVDRQEYTALIDSGCSQTLVSKAVCRFWKRKSAGVLTADGRIFAEDMAE